MKLIHLDRTRFHSTYSWSKTGGWSTGSSVVGLQILMLASMVAFVWLWYSTRGVVGVVDVTS